MKNKIWKLKVRGLKFELKFIQLQIFSIQSLMAYLQPKASRPQCLVSSFQFPVFVLQFPASNFLFSTLFFFSLFVSHSANAQQLQSYIKEAEENSPEIQALQYRYELTAEKAEEAGGLPDTELSAGYFASEPETRTGPQKARFSVRQMLPWFGTITARKNYAASMADAEYVEISIAKRKLALAVAQSYYRLYALQAKQAILLENVELLDTYHELALTFLEVGSASAVDVLRLQMRQNDLVQQAQTLEQDAGAEKLQFEKLLNSKESRPLLIPESLAVPDKDFSEEKISEVHPELLKFEQLYTSVAEAESLNRKEALPKIGVGLDYVSVAERADMDFTDNGKDILMPMLSVAIPIFSNKYRSVSRQNELRQKEIRAQQQNRLLKLQTMLKEAVSERASARITAATYLKNLEQAKDAEEILLKNYETGTIDFNDVLEIQEMQLKFQLGHIEAVKNFYMQATMVNYLSN
ncbi:TolC family protein [Zunongwangia sp. F363]|uniref:TolC family protein n=1 Tax=Autumnicola tepida TaxID=3075595 RepID=A0ABU3CBQ5_9FLAO|nr:TolC family protein [Zunongwangia sp. F363]MDT0643647.1 TolC family protein [Zunongwangia sp. F363]